MKITTIAFLTAFMLPSFVFAQVDRTHAPNAGPAPVIELGKSTLLSLPNGLQLIIVENHRLPKISWTLSLDYTPILEGSKTGMIDMFGDLMQSGTSSHSKAELDEAIDFLGASISANAKGIRASSLTKHSDELLKLMSEILFEPSFSSSELDKLRTQALSNLAVAETSPQEISYNLTSVLNYGYNHPYGEVTTAENLESISTQDFIDFHETYFRPNICYLVVVGDISPESALEKASQYFGSWKKGEVPNNKYDVPTRPKGTRVCLSPVDGSVQSVLKLTHIVSMLPGSDDAITASVMNSILGGGAFSGRLMQNLREDKAFTYGARSSIKTDPLIGSFTAYADVRNEVTDSAVYEFISEIRRIINEPVDSLSLAITKNFMTGNFARSLERPNTVARFALNIQRYNLPEDYYSTYLEKLASVTIEDIQNVARTYLRPDQINITCVGSRDVIESLKKFSNSNQVELFDAFGNPLIERSDAAPGVTAESVILNHYKSVGGKKSLSKFDGISRVGSIEMAGGMTLSFNHIASFKKGKIGSKTTFSISGQEIYTSVINDAKGAEAQMGPVSLLEGGELILKQWKELDPLFLLNTTKYNISKELQGVEDINGVKYHVIKFILEDAFSMISYFEIESGRLASSKITRKIAENSITTTTKFNNYLDLGNGFSFPMEIVVQSNSQSFAIRIGSIQINPEIDYTIFELD